MDVFVFIYPLILLIIVYLFFRYYLPRVVFKVAPKEVTLISSNIKNSGKRIDSLSCGGIVSGIYIGKGFLRLEIYECGIWLKPVLIIPFGIEKKNIKSVNLNKKKNNYILTVIHSSNVILSPLEINLGYGDFPELVFNILGK